MARKQGFQELKFSNRDTFFHPDATWLAGVENDDNDQQIEEYIEEEEEETEFIPDPYKEISNPSAPTNDTFKIPHQPEHKTIKTQKREMIMKTQKRQIIMKTQKRQMKNKMRLKTIKHKKMKKWK